MAVITVFLCIFVLILFILTRVVWINVIWKDGLRLEIHLPILALYLKRRKEKNPPKKSTRQKLSLSSYRHIVKRITRLLGRAEITIKKLTLPIKDNEFDKSTVTKTYRNHSIVSAFFAYLDTKAQKLNVYEDAVNLNAASSEVFCFDLSIKTELYIFLLGFMTIMYERRKQKTLAR